MIAPLLSRSRVFRLEPLSAEQIEGLLRRALTDEERGIGHMQVTVDDETLKALANISGGDARIALNALELAAQTARPDKSGKRVVTSTHIDEALQKRAALYDRAGDWHYDIVSAFIKSLRGSDPDAALYWLARMLEAGEDPLFVARRLVILAAEDVGLADPQALQVAVAAQQAVHFIGMPEGFFPLAEATLYLATAPKSNSVGEAYMRALQDAQATVAEPVPLHLRNAPTPLMREMGYGRDYTLTTQLRGHYVEPAAPAGQAGGLHVLRPGDWATRSDVTEWMEGLGGGKSAGGLTDFRGLVLGSGVCEGVSEEAGGVATPTTGVAAGVAGDDDAVAVR